MTNLCFPFSLFNFLVLASFMLEVKELGDRMEFGGTMLLAAIALKFAFRCVDAAELELLLPLLQNKTSVDS